MQIHIGLEDLHMSYQEKTVLDGLSFTLKKGETLGLLGPNGAGKTTTLDLILGIKQPTAGQVYLFGTPPKKLAKQTFQRIGVQFQHSFYPDYITVEETCQMTSALYPETTPYQELLKRFQLLDKKTQKVSSLSGGEKQKLAVLLSLINKPELVLLDELTTGLDPEARRDVWQILKELQAEGLSILLTSHYMDEVEQLCDRILILNKGKIQFQGSPSDLKDRYKGVTLEDAYLAIIKEEAYV